MVSRLRTAQLDLAMERRHGERTVLEGPQEEEHLLWQRAATLAVAAERR
jgi:hypothetical protein